MTTQLNNYVKADLAKQVLIQLEGFFTAPRWRNYIKVFKYEICDI